MNPYAAVARARRRSYASHPARQRRLSRPVISIGNIAAGGRAKSPLVAWIAARLLAAGERPSILSRGYARRQPSRDVVVVRDDHGVRADLDRAGDEPLMIARQLEGACVLVCADRHAAGLVAERQLGCTVHVLDDGFQHLALHRDLDVVAIAKEDLANPRTFPFGRLREPIDALDAADAILALDDTEVCARVSNAPVFRARRHTEPPRLFGEASPAASGQPAAVAVAGIAEPAQFFSSLRSLGWPVAATLTFRDHHAYSDRDIRRLADAARQQGTDVIVTTEKDLVRLLPFRPWPFRVAVAPLTITVEPAAEFDALVAQRLRAVRGDAR